MTFFIILSIIYIALCIGDILTTKKALSYQGALEANPVIRFFMEKFGKKWWLAKLSINVILIAVFACFEQGVWGILGMAMMMVAIVVWNLFAIKKLKERNNVNS